MSVPVHVELLEAIACCTWLAAGLQLLVQTRETRSRPDYLVAIGLLGTGLLLGMPGVWPGLALLLAGGAFSWALSTDEADALQPGDCIVPTVAATAVMLGLAACAEAFATPTLGILGLQTRPLEAPACLLFAWLWCRARRRQHRVALHFGGLHLRSLTFAATFAALVSALGEPVPGAAHGLLTLGLVAYLRQRLASQPQAGARTCAAALLACLGLGLLEQAQGPQRQATRAERTLDRVAAVGAALATLQEPVDVAVEGWIHDEPRQLFARRSRHCADRLGKLRELPFAAAERRTFEELELAVASQARWCRETLQEVAIRRSADSEPSVVARAEAHALAARQEARLAWLRALQALESLRGAATDEVTAMLGDLRRLQSLAIALLVGVALLAGSRPVRQRADGVTAPAAAGAGSAVPGFGGFPARIVCLEDSAAGTAQAPPPPPRYRGKVLVVESDPDQRRQVEELLLEAGIEVAAAADAATAANELEQSTFDLVLMDMQGEGLDGHAATAALRARNDHTPVLALTGAAETAARERCLAAGCNGNLNLPLDPTALHAALGRYLETNTDDHSE